MKDHNVNLFFLFFSDTLFIVLLIDSIIKGYVGLEGISAWLIGLFCVHSIFYDKYINSKRKYDAEQFIREKIGRSD